MTNITHEDIVRLFNFLCFGHSVGAPPNNARGYDENDNGQTSSAEKRSKTRNRTTTSERTSSSHVSASNMLVVVIWNLLTHLDWQVLPHTSMIVTASQSCQSVTTC